VRAPPGSPSPPPLPPPPSPRTCDAGAQLGRQRGRQTRAARGGEGWRGRGAHIEVSPDGREHREAEACEVGVVPNLRRGTRGATRPSREANAGRRGGGNGERQGARTQKYPPTDASTGRLRLVRAELDSTCGGGRGGATRPSTGEEGGKRAPRVKGEANRPWEAAIVRERDRSSGKWKTCGDAAN